MLVIAYNCSLHVFSHSSVYRKPPPAPPTPIYFHTARLYVQEKWQQQNVTYLWISLRKEQA